MRARFWVALSLCSLGCGGRPSNATAPSLDTAAESYVRLVLALGERDGDSLDAYHGPPEWQADARTAHATLPEVRAAAASLAETLESPSPKADEVRRRFLTRQLRAVVARIDVINGRRAPFVEEAHALFGLDVQASDHGTFAAAVRGEI